MGLQDHKECRIICGVLRAPGDNNSVENKMLTIDLLDSAGGISMTSWSPSLAPLEQGGIWTDSPLTVGRQPLVINEGNVIETIRITINGGSALATAKKYADLNTMIIRSRAFWTDNAQYDPVYLHWFSACGAGKQYALIYNMEFKPNYEDSTANIITGSLTIEREPYWRFLPPGASPMQWRYEYHNQPYDYGKSNPGNMGQSANDLFIFNGVNREEWSAGIGSNPILQPLLTTNIATIPAALIPGDAPALITFQSTASDHGNLLMGKHTRKIPTILGASPYITPIFGSFNATDGTLGTDATRANDTGGVKPAGSGTAQRVAISFATATNALRWQLGGSNISSLLKSNNFIGRWMVFLRCRQSAGNVGDITMYLRYANNTPITSNSDGQKLNVVYPPVTTGGTGNSTLWGMVYMGIVTMPMWNAKAEVNAGGNTGDADGLASLASVGFDFALYALRSTGTAVLYLNDLILIPIDEGSIQIEGADSSVGNSNTYDETGYYTHGSNELMAVNGIMGTSMKAAKISGPGIQLTPGVDNYLFTLFYDANQQSKAVGNAIGFNLNIIPRCRGIRTFSNLAGASASG